MKKICDSEAISAELAAAGLPDVDDWLNAEPGAATDFAAEDGLLQKEKDGLEIDQGLFLAAVLRGARSGRHLCHAMLLARPEAEALLPEFAKTGVVELAGASVQRRGKAAIVTFDNPRFL